MERPTAFIDQEFQHSRDSNFPQIELYRFNAMLTNIPVQFLVDIDKLMLKFIWRGTGPTTAKRILKKKDKVGGLTVLDIQSYYTAIATLTMTEWYWPRDRHIDQRYRILNPEVNPSKHAQQILNKHAKAILWRKLNFLNKWCWSN